MYLNCTVPIVWGCMLMKQRAYREKDGSCGQRLRGFRIRVFEGLGFGGSGSRWRAFRYRLLLSDHEVES